MSSEPHDVRSIPGQHDATDAVTALLTSELAPALAAGALTTDADILAGYATDEALFCPGGGAVGLVRATGVADVQATVRFASAHGIPIVPQGARTGISGGANAVPGCLLLSLERMNRILTVNEAERTVTVEPGIVNQDLKNALAERGFSYPPDPGSVAICTIGGNVATNAGGLCCVKYGVTRDYVRSLTVVLADGTLTRLGAGTAKSVAGLNLRDLFIGSEGTLGVIVEVTLRILPLLPEPLTAVATFPDARAAAAVVADVMAAGIQPSILESLDGTTLRLLNEYGNFGLDERAGAMLLMQSDGSGSAAAAREDVEAFIARAEAGGAIDTAYSDDAADNAALVTARRMTQPAWEKYAHAHGDGQLLDDICIPRSRMTDFYDRLNDVRAESGLTIAVVAHAGDGNIHPSVFFDVHDPADVARAQHVFDRIMQLGLDLGGTITGEHGVGYLKRSWLPRELDAGSRALHRAVKDAVDPAGILNPGKMLAEV